MRVPKSQIRRKGPIRKSRTKKKRSGFVNPGLKLLADFMNVDFGVIGEEDLKRHWHICRSILHGIRNPSDAERRAYERLSPLVHLVTGEHELSSPRLVDDLRAGQKEVLTDLRQIISEPGNATTVRGCLVQIVRKVNALQFISQWRLDSLDKFAGDDSPVWRSFYDPSDPNTIRDTSPPSAQSYSSGQRVLNIGEGKWIVRRVFPKLPSPRQRLYEVIISALESGELSRLKKCLECQRFFVAEDTRMKFCPPECYKSNDRRKAVGRSRKSRNNKKEAHRERRWVSFASTQRAKKEKEQKTAQMAAKQKDRRGFATFMRNPDHHRPTIKKLGKGNYSQGWKVIQKWEKKQKAGVSLQEIWQSLPVETRKVFSSNSS